MSGLARAREWDATTVAELPELAGTPLRELEFRAFPETLVPDDEARRALAAALDRELVRPYAARAVRRDSVRWALGAKALRAELVELARDLSAASLEVAVAPDGALTTVVDGMEPVVADDATRRALDELERRGRERFQSFVARADRLEDDRWELTIDPL